MTDVLLDGRCGVGNGPALLIRVKQT